MSEPLPKMRHIGDAYDIGKYWVSVSYHPDNPPFRFLNWRTGEMRTVRHVLNGRDLNSRDLKPMKLQKFTPRPPGYSPDRDVNLSVCRGRDVVVTEYGNELRLWWSQSSSVQIGRGGFLYDNCEWYDPLRIGSHKVTWSKGPSVHAYNYETGAHFDRRFKYPGSRITPVRDGVIVAIKGKTLGKYYHKFRLKFFSL
jgi:hypothetical protein